MPKELGEGLREIADPELRACLELLAAQIAASSGPPSLPSESDDADSRDQPEQMKPMKPTTFLACAAAPLSRSRAAIRSRANAATNAPVKVKAVAAAQGRRLVARWSAATPAGGFVMGNPNAKVKLIEYGSLTCPHCREFDEKGVQPLIANYVKTGQVSWEFRNYVRDAFDLPPR